MAFGLGFGMAQRTNIIAAVVPTHEIGIASSILALGRNIAGAFGIAIFATMLQTSTETNVFAIAKNSTYHGTTLQQYQQFIGLITLKAQISSYHAVFFVSALIVFIGGFLILTMQNVDLKSGMRVHVE
jgi:MFS family permease